MVEICEAHVIDLRDPVKAADQEYTVEHVVEWLRTSGGNLQERTMKVAAARIIETAQQEAQQHREARVALLGLLNGGT